jgi:hypothetical protein
MNRPYLTLLGALLLGHAPPAVLADAARGG